MYTLALLPLLFAQEAVDGLDAVARRTLREHKHPGLVVGLLREGKPSVQGFGRVSLDRPEAPDGRTIYEIGSITKTFTAALLAHLAAQGKLALDDPVARHLPEGWTMPSREGAVVTLAHLASHTSGLPRLPHNLGAKRIDDPYAEYSEARLRDFLGSHRLGRAPGDKYEYSNLGTGLLGWTLGRIDGRGYEAALAERVLVPLQLEDTRVTLDEARRARLAPGYADGRPVRNWDLATLAGAGALKSTADDLLRWLAANLGEAPGELKRVLAVTHEKRAAAGGPAWVGLGWHVSPLGDRTMVWHNGGTGGYRSFAGFVPETRTAAVVLANSTGDVDAAGVAILELLQR